MAYDNMTHRTNQNTLVTNADERGDKGDPNSVFEKLTLANKEVDHQAHINNTATWNDSVTL